MTASVPDFLSHLRPEARDVPDSGIVTAVNYGRNRDGLIPLWAGEGDLPTPGFICDAATRSLAAGETFYTWQRGIPELREALAAYHTDLYDRPFAPDRFIVTGSGMQAIQFAVQSVAGKGASVVVPTPAWPNAAAAIELRGAVAKTVPMTFSPHGWSLDLQAVMDACDATTTAIFVNTPCNPTGWVMGEDDMRALLAFARERGLWIIADEIYTRFTFDARPRTPSFMDVADADDRIFFVNTFSKNWAMTGWRIGWIVIPDALGQVMENLVQYNTSGVAAFMQRAATVALTRGEDFVRFQIERARQGRRIICDGLAATGKVELAPPDGGFYAFFSIVAEADTEALALRLIDEANVGLAPGTAFGPGGERFMRLCFARKDSDLEIAIDRLSTWINQNG